MFHSSRSKNSSSVVSGGLPTFSPKTVARALAREPKPEAPKPKPPAAPGPTATTIHIDLGSTIRGAVAVAEFFAGRAAKKREAAIDLEGKAMTLAAEYQGIVGVPDLIMRTGCDRAQALRALEALEKASLCRFLCHYQDEALYVFPGYLPRAWECDYCLAKVSVPSGTPASALCRCGGCGAMMSQKILD
jgi:hypothetical protein